MHEVLADVVEELLGANSAAGGMQAPGSPVGSEAAAAADAWMLVSELGAQPCRDNSMGALFP